MVTHRWWGNKFCKRACKNAHRRENHQTQSGWVIPRFFTFAGDACLAAAVAVAIRAGYWSLFARCCVGGRKQQREQRAF